MGRDIVAAEIRCFTSIDLVGAQLNLECGPTEKGLWSGQGIKT